MQLEQELGMLKLTASLILAGELEKVTMVRTLVFEYSNLEALRHIGWLLEGLEQLVCQQLRWSQSRALVEAEDVKENGKSTRQAGCPLASTQGLCIEDLHHQ
jgi:hypothetical protein